jgi:FdhD protein
VIAEREAIRRITYCVDAAEDEQRYNVVNVELAAVELPETARLERHFVVGSACGVCGRATLDELRARCEPLAPGPVVTPELIYGLPERLREQQRLFASTGGLHAAGLFDETGELLAVREDVGRHNAVDKLIGWALLADRLPLQRCMLLVSGRASYEIVQKAAVARIPIVCAVSAPSSLAVALAHQFDITLIGFLRARRFNLYSSSSRIALGSPRTTDLR